MAKTLVVDELTKLSRMPGDENHGEFRHLYWENSLRDHPNFEKIVVSRAPDPKKPQRSFRRHRRLDPIRTSNRY
jgi:hypothetical protein